MSTIQPAVGSYFKNGFFPTAYEYSLYSSPVLVDCTLPGLTVTELTGTDFVVVAPGAVINVSLAETDPHLNWELIAGNGVQYAGNSLQEAYPVKHVFKLKAIRSGTVLFKMIDDRDGKTVKTFQLNLAVPPPLAGLGWPAFSKDLAPSFAWPIQIKFGVPIFL